MSISVQSTADTTTITMSGRLGFGRGVEEFRAFWEQAIAAGCRRLIVDLTAVRMVDSSAIGSMVRCHAAMSKEGGIVCLQGAAGNVLQALKVTRLEKLFELLPGSDPVKA